MRIYTFLLRISLGILFFYAGITKVINPHWSAAGYLKGAQTFSGFYNFLLQPNILPIINFVNEWGLTLLGISLLLGIFVRLSSKLGALLMLLYYIPILHFPYVGKGTMSFLVDEHIILILSLLLVGSLKAGRFLGLEKWCSSLPICSKYPKLRELLG
ncbi:MAG: DoxX family membrane protein [bacterium]|nr:DoxX family membrane protein [bacterium]